MRPVIALYVIVAVSLLIMSVTVSHFKVLDQKGSRCIVTAIGDNPCSPILQFLQRPQSCFTTASPHTEQQ